MLTVELRGRLGNQMFQYAICRTVAEKNNYNFYVSKEKNGTGQNISDFFDLEMGKIDYTHINFYFIEKQNQEYDESIFNINDNTRLIGFFQTEKYFKENEDKVKSWFKVEKTEDVVAFQTKYPIDEYCYIHFRGGDYKEWCNGEKLLSKVYYEKSIQKIKEINENAKFVVITDDIVLAKEYFKNIDIVSNDLFLDFKLLYFSKYCIIPNSSFSWWASWLSEKKFVIAPQCWLNYNNQALGFEPIDIKSNKFFYIC